MAFIILYVTHKNQTEAEKIASHLLNKRLIACVNYLPIKSSYWWNEKIENSNEIVTILKTRKELEKEVTKEILKIHPYKTPCIMKLDVSANESYEDWINKETKGKP